MRGLVYCIHLLGVGHLKMMLTLSEALVQLGKVDFIQGGKDVGLSLVHPHFRHIILPEYIQAPSNTHLITGQGYESLKQRRQHLFDSLDFSAPYDYLLVEQIPFTKLLFWNEVRALIQILKMMNPRLLVCCCHRGIQRQARTKMDPLNYKMFIKNEPLTVQIIKGFFDAVLIHTDPRLISFDETFDLASLIADKLIYTGFIAKKPMESGAPRMKRILISTGSGKHGEILYPPLLTVAGELPDYQFLFVMGPFRPENVQADLEKEIAKRKLSNVFISEFIQDFETELSKSALAITLGGTTVFALCGTQTPAIVFPLAGDIDQGFIAEKFGHLGLIHVGTSQDLSPDKMLALVRKGLETPYPEIASRLNFNGIENSRRAIESLVAKKKDL